MLDVEVYLEIPRRYGTIAVGDMSYLVCDLRTFRGVGGLCEEHEGRGQYEQDRNNDTLQVGHCE